MKKVISIGLILLLSAQSLYKLGVLAYFQFNREWITEVFCINKEKPITLCYGSCFLEKEMTKADQQKEPTLPSSSQTKFEIPFFVVSERYHLPSTTLAKLLHPLQGCLSELEGHAPPIFHPPLIIA